MEIKEIKAKDLDAQKFIAEKVEEISSIVGDGLVINALSGVLIPQLLLTMD